MAENENQNNLEESVRNMIRDRIAKMRDEGSKASGGAGTSSAADTPAKPEVKTKQPVIGEQVTESKAAQATEEELKKQEEAKKEELRRQEEARKEELKRKEEAKKEELKSQEAVKEEELKKQEEAKKEELKRQEEEREEELRKQREEEKEELRKQKEARKEEERKQKEELKKQKEAKKEEIRKQKEEQRKEKEAKKQEELKLKEELKAEKANPKADENKVVADMKKAVGAAAESESQEPPAENASGEPSDGNHKEGVWKTFVDRMNSESAGDDELGRDIEDEKADDIFFSPEEKKRKRTLGFVKLYATLSAIAAIAIIITFFTVRNNSFRHIYGQAVQAFNEEDYDSALATFEKLALTEEGEHNIDVLNYLAQSYIKKNRLQDALDVYNRALQTDPTFGPAITGLCEMYTRMKDGKALNATLDKYRGSNMEEFIADYMVKDPSVNPDAGKYEEDLEIALTAEANVPIFFTADGSDPNEQSQIYSKPIKVSEGTTQIKAIAINTLGIHSGIVEKSYTVEYRIPSEPKIALNSGIYVTGQTVTISGDEGCDIYYTTDGSTPTRYSDKYTGPLRLVKGNVILTAIAISNHGKESPIASKNYIIVRNAKELEQVEQMNQPTTQPAQEGEQSEESSEGEEDTLQNPNETDAQYLDDEGQEWYEEENENEGEEGLFDWLLNGRDGRRN